MLRRYKLYFAAVVLAVTIFLVSFSHDSLRHVQSYNSGAIRNGVSAVIEMKKINSYKPSLLGKTSTEIIRWIHLTFYVFVAGSTDKYIRVPRFSINRSCG